MLAIGFTPHKKQKEILDSILTQSTKFHVVSVGRQFGKSLMGLNLLLYWAINESPCKILWVSPVYSQSNKIQKELFEAIQESGLIKNINFSDNYIQLKNKTEIIFRSAERYDNIRGWTFDYAILDEAAFMKQEAWTEAIRPTLSVRGKKVLFLSTPKGKNWFHDLYQLGLSDNPNYMSYQGSSRDTPYIDPQEIEDAKKTLPDKVFKQEYLAEFLDDGGEVFSNLNEITFNQWPAGDTPKYYCGIDLGRQEDWTVATVLNSEGQVVEIYRNHQVNWDVMINDLVKLINKWNAITLVEVNSIGDVIFDSLKRKVKQIRPFVTTSKSKQDVIEALILAVNNRDVQIPSQKLFEPLYNEMSYFTYEYNPRTRSVKYGHPKGLHDDCVMSLAISWSAYKSQRSLGQYNWIV